MTRHAARLWRGRLVLVLLLAWWVSQWAALVHSVDHPATGLTHAHVVQAAGHERGHGRGHERGHERGHGQGQTHDQSRDWGHEAGTPACDLFDALLGSPAFGGAPPALFEASDAAVAWGACKPPMQPGVVRLAYQARGPPVA